ncbi:MAG: hypothetical protein H0T62_01635 [Parachlamydiaceae bacterium]|nr:hypothetical protein [Parachlamydiaceae bacterium]
MQVQKHTQSGASSNFWDCHFRATLDVTNISTLQQSEYCCLAEVLLLRPYSGYHQKEQP